MTLAELAGHFQRTAPHLVGSRLLVALSGGADSVALLHLLHAADLGLELEAAHVHHGVRGPEADADATFCATLCGDLGVPFHLVRLQPAPHPPEGREAAWRRARYRALHSLARERGAAAVATAHHRDDVAEGVLVQLLRGAGPRALAGITALDSGIVRPLLPYSRAELEGYLRSRGLRWREDSSNRDLSHLRNLVRHSLLPTLEAAVPQLRSHLVHLAGALAEDEAFLAASLAARATFIDPWDPAGGVPRPAVAGLPPALRHRWLQAQAARCGIGRVTRRQLGATDSLLDTAAPRAVTLGGRWRLRLVRDTLWLEPPDTPPPLCATLTPGEARDLPLPGWEVRLVAAADRDPGARWHRRWRGDVAELRGPRPGDVVGPPGAPRRLAPQLAAVLPRHLRAAWPVFCEGDTITWVPGVWTDPDTRENGRLVLEVRRR